MLNLYWNVNIVLTTKSYNDILSEEFGTEDSYENIDEEDLVEVAIESELKLTDAQWNDSLSDSESDYFTEMQYGLEDEMTEIFCTEINSTLESVDNETCTVEVTGFTEGSVNVQFTVERLEMNSSLPTDDELVADMQNKMAKKGFKKFAVDKKSIKISK